MTKPRHRAEHRADQTTQISIVFPMRHALDAEQQAAVIALLSQLLLQVATAEHNDEVPDEPS